MRHRRPVHSAAGLFSLLACLIAPASSLAHGIEHGREHFDAPSGLLARAHAGEAGRTAVDTRTSATAGPSIAPRVEQTDADRDHEPLHMAAATTKFTRFAAMTALFAPPGSVVVPEPVVATASEVVMHTRTGAPPTTTRQPSQPRAPPID